MARAHHYRRRVTEPTELDVTTFLNLMVVLIPFLLITAVFSRITIVELDLPTTSGGAAPKEPTFRVEVIVREEGLEVTNGTMVIAGIPNVDGEYNLDRLAEYMLALKHEHPDTNQASVLLEPTIPYDYLIQVMDVVRSADIEPDPADQGDQTDQPDEVDGSAVADAEGEDDPAADTDRVEPTQLALFTEISIGEAP
jgi:biopolymer transport protein ExbD